MRFIFRYILIYILFTITENHIFGQVTIGKKDTTIIKKINICGSDDEYSPFLYRNKLFFTSNKLLNVGILNWDQEGGNTTNIFCAIKKDSINFIQVNPITAINTKLNDGPISISNNGLYFASNNISKNSILNNKSIVFRIYYVDSVFKEAPVEIKMELTEDISITHPMIIKDSVLYFTGIVKNSKSGSDIYVSTKIGTNWSNPLKLNESINSIYNECFPFYYDGKLYFSSDRINGKGALDLYIYDKGIVKPFNELNSDKDDFGLYIDNINNGYFSSNREGTDDVFYFSKSIKPNFDSCKLQIVNNYNYEFKEETDYEFKDTLNMLYEWDFGDGTKKRGLVVNHYFEQGEGKYLIKLNAIQKESGIDFNTELESEFELKNIKQLYISSYDTLSTDSLSVFESSFSNIENFEIKKYYWDINDGMCYEGATFKYQFNKEGEYIIKLLALGTLNNTNTTKGVYKKIVVLKNFDNRLKKLVVPIYKKTTDEN